MNTKLPAPFMTTYDEIDKKEIDCYSSAQMLAFREQRDAGIENESEILLNWFISQVSKEEFARIGIDCPPGCSVDYIKQSMKTWKKPVKQEQAPSDSSIEKDAARYRWLKQNIESDHDLPFGYWLDDTGKTWDKTIDAAMQESQDDES